MRFEPLESPRTAFHQSRKTRFSYTMRMRQVLAVQSTFLSCCAPLVTVCCVCVFFFSLSQHIRIDVFRRGIDVYAQLMRSLAGGAPVQPRPAAMAASSANVASSDVTTEQADTIVANAKTLLKKYLRKHSKQKSKAHGWQHAVQVLKNLEAALASHDADIAAGKQHEGEVHETCSQLVKATPLHCCIAAFV